MTDGGPATGPAVLGEVAGTMDGLRCKALHRPEFSQLCRSCILCIRLAARPVCMQMPTSCP
eukprot:3832576-Prorocentrum_lima.AAC.1